MTKERFEVAGAVWLITPMLQDAEAGCFGDPVWLPIDAITTAEVIPHIVGADEAERFKTQVEDFKTNLPVLTKPVLISQRSDGSVREIYDGRHRLQALMSSGWSHFRAWSVPPEAAARYMIRPELIAAAAAELAARA